MRIVRYLEGTCRDGLTFRSGSIELIAFVDAAYNCYEDSKGHYGFSLSLGLADASFFAKSSKMKLVVLSSTEAEYVALCEATKAVVWSRRFLSEIGFPPAGPTTIYEDNQSCIDMVYGKISQAVSKHIRPKFHYTREQVIKGEVQVVYLPTKQMVADVLTKPLCRKSHENFAKDLLNIEE